MYTVILAHELIQKKAKLRQSSELCWAPPYSNTPAFLSAFIQLLFLFSIMKKLQLKNYAKACGESNQGSDSFNVSG